MKYIKKYESINIHEPKVGDYVIVDVDTTYKIIKNYLDDKIGIINKLDEIGYLIEFEDSFPDDFWEITNVDRKITVFKREIKYWSENKKELESLLFSNKYNL
jgi:hypothetical protein